MKAPYSDPVWDAVRALTALELRQCADDRVKKIGRETAMTDLMYRAANELERDFKCDGSA